MYYTNYSNIDNTPKQNTTKKIQIKHKTSNIPPTKLKINKKEIKKIFDSYKLVDDSSKDITSKKNDKKAKKFKLQNQLEILKKENAKKAKKLKSLKSKQGKINLDTFVKNTLKKYKEPKPKKKSIWDVIEIPKPLVI